MFKTRTTPVWSACQEFNDKRFNYRPTLECANENAVNFFATFVNIVKRSCNVNVYFGKAMRSCGGRPGPSVIGACAM